MSRSRSKSEGSCGTFKIKLDHRATWKCTSGLSQFEDRPNIKMWLGLAICSVFIYEWVLYWCGQQQWEAESSEGWHPRPNWSNSAKYTSPVSCCPPLLIGCMAIHTHIHTYTPPPPPFLQIHSTFTPHCWECNQACLGILEYSIKWTLLI